MSIETARDSGVECGNCGCTDRRPDTNRCASCGRFAADPRYGYSDMTDTWYRVADYDDLGDGKFRAKSKEQVARPDVPDWVVSAIEEER